MSLQVWSVVAAGVQAVGSVLAIFVAVWVAGIPIRSAERDRAKVQRERLEAIRDAGALLIEFRRPTADAILTRDEGRWETASKALDSSDLALATSVMGLPIEYWPSIPLHSATRGLLSAAAELDEALANTVWGVVRANPQMMMPRARRFMSASLAFETALAAHGLPVRA